MKFSAIFIVFLIHILLQCCEASPVITTTNFHYNDCLLHQPHVQECECPGKLDRKLYHIEQENRECSATTNPECSCVSTQQQNCVPTNSASSEIYRNPQLISVPIINTECTCISKLCEPCLKFVPVNSATELYNNILNIPTIDSVCSCVSKQQNLLFNCTPIDSVSQSPCGASYNYPQRQFAPAINTNTKCGCVSKQQSNYYPIENTLQYGTCNNPQFLNNPTTSTECCCVPKQHQANCVPADSASQYAGTYYNPQFTSVPHQQSVVNQLMYPYNCLLPQNVCYQKM